MKIPTLGALFGGWALISACLLAACGEDGRPQSGGEENVAYTGKTTQARITPENAEKLAAAVFYFGYGRGNIPPFEAG